MRQASHWRLLSNRSADLAAAAERIQWYGTRWSIEVFFPISKTMTHIVMSMLSMTG
jgi:hypothetical protein